MADDPNSTKAAFDKNWVSATEVGEYVTQSNSGAWILAPVDIREALLGDCSAVLELDQGGQKNIAVPPPGFWFPPDRLRWVNALNPSMRREDFPHRPWPWELRAYLLPSERHFGEQLSTLRVFLRRAKAVQWGLWPAQAVVSEESPSPDKQLNNLRVGIQASAHAQNAPEQPGAKTILPPSAPGAASTPEAGVEPESSLSATGQTVAEPGPTPPTEPVPSLSELAAQEPQLAELQPEKSQTEEREPKKQWEAKDARTWLIQRLIDDRPKGNWAKWARDTYVEMRKDFKNELPWSDWPTLRRRMSDPDIWKEVEKKSGKKN